VGFKAVVPSGRRYLCTQVELSCQVVSEIFTNGDPVIEGQLLKNALSSSQISPSNIPRSHRGGKRYSSTLHLTSALDGNEWSGLRSGHFIPGKSSGYPLWKRLYRLRAGMEGCRKSHPHWISIPNHSVHNEALYRLRYPGHNHGFKYA